MCPSCSNIGAISHLRTLVEELIKSLGQVRVQCLSRSNWGMFSSETLAVTVQDLSVGGGFNLL
jgi:hypothetical protein